MKRNLQTIKNWLLAFFLFGMGSMSIAQVTTEPMDTGKFEPTWASLKQYLSAPEWYRDAKFGIWAHLLIQLLVEHPTIFIWIQKKRHLLLFQQ